MAQDAATAVINSPFVIISLRPVLRFVMDKYSRRSKALKLSFIEKKNNVSSDPNRIKGAKKGYAVASISYRLAMNGKSFGCDYLTKENAVPMLFFHGKLDFKVPYEIAAHHHCGPNSQGYLILDGPLEITNKLKSLDVSYTLYTDPNGGHEWAELGYTFTTIITDFLYTNIWNNTPIQKTAIISKPKTTTN